MLHIRRFGEGSPLLALHGFTLTGAQFESSAAMLGREIVAPDLPGHGHSASHNADVTQTVASIAAVVDSYDQPIPILGYSQGARLALLLATTTETPVDSLVLVSGSPGIESNANREERALADAVTAASIQSDGIDRFLDGWTTTGLTSTDFMNPDDRASDALVRAQNTADGLSAALIGFGQGAQPSVWSQLGEVDSPTLLLTGDQDTKYTALNARMEHRLASGQHTIIADAGHNPLAEQPERSYAAIRSFLDRLG